MRILMTADNVGGVFVYALELARDLLERGCKVSLALQGAALSGEQRARLRALSKLDVYTRECKLEWMDEPWRDVADTGHWLRELADKLRPDCIHLNEFAHANLDWPAPVIVVGH